MLVIVDERRVTGYLLNLQHTQGAAKARYFQSFGYASSAPETSGRDLIWHATAYQSHSRRETGYGAVIEVVGVIVAPNGQAMGLKSVWISEELNTLRLITAMPG